MIELLSGRADAIELPEDAVLTPLPLDDEISSLSAILMDADYYQFLREGKTVLNDIPVLDAAHLIPFKAKAWLDLTERSRNGEHVDGKNIRKHKNDVFRLSQYGGYHWSLCCIRHGYAGGSSHCAAYIRKWLRQWT